MKEKENLWRRLAVVALVLIAVVAAGNGMQSAEARVVAASAVLGANVRVLGEIGVAVSPSGDLAVITVDSGRLDGRADHLFWLRGLSADGLASLISEGRKPGSISWNNGVLVAGSTRFTSARIPDVFRATEIGHSDFVRLKDRSVVSILDAVMAYGSMSTFEGTDEEQMRRCLDHPGHSGGLPATSCSIGGCPGAPSSCSVGCGNGSFACCFCDPQQGSLASCQCYIPPPQ